MQLFQLNWSKKHNVSIPAQSSLTPCYQLHHFLWLMLIPTLCQACTQLFCQPTIGTDVVRQMKVRGKKLIVLNFVFKYNIHFIPKICEFIYLNSYILIYFLTLSLSRGEVCNCGVTMGERCAKVYSAHNCAFGLCLYIDTQQYNFLKILHQFLFWPLAIHHVSCSQRWSMMFDLVPA